MLAAAAVDRGRSANRTHHPQRYRRAASETAERPGVPPDGRTKDQRGAPVRTRRAKRAVQSSRSTPRDLGRTCRANWADRYMYARAGRVRTHIRHVRRRAGRCEVKTMDIRAWLTVAEAVQYAAVSRDTIYTARERGELRHVR